MGHNWQTLSKDTIHFYHQFLHKLQLSHKKLTPGNIYTEVFHGRTEWTNCCYQRSFPIGPRTPSAQPYGYRKHLCLHGFPLENPMWNWKPSRAAHFITNKCILANNSINSFCITTQPNSEQLKELIQAIGSTLNIFYKIMTLPVKPNPLSSTEQLHKIHNSYHISKLRRNFYIMTPEDF